MNATFCSYLFAYCSVDTLLCMNDSAMLNKAEAAAQVLALQVGCSMFCS